MIVISIACYSVMRYKALKDKHVEGRTLHVSSFLEDILGCELNTYYITMTKTAKISLPYNLNYLGACTRGPYKSIIL
jgi:hypothetical protein